MNCTYNSIVGLYLYGIQISSGKSLIRFNNLAISFEIILILRFLKGKIKREDGWGWQEKFGQREYEQLGI